MKGLKSTRGAPALSPAEMLQAAGSAAPEQPPAIAHAVGSDRSAMLSVRLTEATLDALADHALSRGATQRRIIAEALAAKGIKVSPRDLEDRPLPRRRGTAPR